jgi:hypothetical protein
MILEKIHQPSPSGARHVKPLRERQNVLNSPDPLLPSGESGVLEATYEWILQAAEKLSETGAISGCVADLRSLTP